MPPQQPGGVSDERAHEYRALPETTTTTTTMMTTMVTTPKAAAGSSAKQVVPKTKSTHETLV